jgi:hypothetical protein
MSQIQLTLQFNRVSDEVLLIGSQTRPYKVLESTSLFLCVRDLSAQFELVALSAEQQFLRASETR